MSDAPRIALILGGDDQTRVTNNSKGGLHNKGSTDVYRLGELDDAIGVQITRNYFRRPRRLGFEKYDLLINLITDADQNSAVLEVLEKALRNSKVPLLNRPDAVLRTTREGVAKRLAGIDNLLVPRVRKVRSASAQVLRGLEQSGAMAFPAILRRAGTHSGRVVGVIGSPDDAPAERNADGYYLIEFVDFASADGLYRKYRLFMFGGAPVFRHMLISDHWNVHAADRERFMMDRPALLEESQGLYERGIDSLPPQVVPVLQEIDKRLGLDFYGVDFGILPDGRLVLFEANGTMNFFPVATDPRLAAMQRCVPPAREAFRKMIASALKALPPSN
ncbi:MAG TPA: hypothetical protein VD768_01920 [Sphingomicrobium sp.]|nr:hypothetical protein [Sphingomicrobium sp.]